MSIHPAMDGKKPKTTVDALELLLFFVEPPPHPDTVKAWILAPRLLSGEGFVPTCLCFGAFTLAWV